MTMYFFNGSVAKPDAKLQNLGRDGKNVYHKNTNHGKTKFHFYLGLGLGIGYGLGSVFVLP